MDPCNASVVLVQCCRAPQQLLEQLSNQLENQQPHFGTRLANQLLHGAQSAVQQAGTAVQQQMPASIRQLPHVQLPNIQLPDAPQLPSVQLPRIADVQLPHVQLPNVQLPEAPQLSLPRLQDVQLPELHAPNIQLPSVQLPAVELPTSIPDSQAVLQSIAAAATTAADDMTHLPSDIQQRLGLLQQQLLQLASTTDSSTLNPHFGTKAFTAWLQQVAQTLSSAVHAPVLQLPAGSPADASLLQNSFSRLTSLPDATAASIESIRASLQVLTAAAVNALPAGVSSVLTSGLHNMQEQSVSAVAGLHQLQDSLLQLQLTLQQLPERGMGGYDLPTLCFIAAGVIAATAASVPAAGAVSGGEDDICDALTHEYDAAAVATYFRRRPVLVAQRSLQLSAEIANFGLALLGDMWTNRLQVGRELSMGHAQLLDIPS